MTDSFASCLKAKLAQGDAASATAAPELRIKLRTVLAGLVRQVRRAG
jgi:hypothetical protein